MDTNQHNQHDIPESELIQAMEELHATTPKELTLFTDAELDEYERIVNARHGTPHEL